MLEDVDYIIARLNSEVCLMPYEVNLESCKFIFRAKTVAILIIYRVINNNNWDRRVGYI